MKKILTTLVLAGSMAFLGAGAAQAEEYPAPGTTVQVSDGTVVVGEAFVFSGSGFEPGEAVVITVSNETAGAAGVSGGLGGGLGAGVTGMVLPTERFSLNATADAEGDFAVEVTLNETGTYTLTATGQESGITQQAIVEVVAAVDGTAAGNDARVSAEGGRLADTGLQSGALLWGGAGVLALGAGLGAVVVARRRNA